MEFQRFCGSCPWEGKTTVGPIDRARQAWSMEQKISFSGARTDHVLKLKQVFIFDLRDPRSASRSALYSLHSFICLVFHGGIDDHDWLEPLGGFSAQPITVRMRLARGK